ncbi:MAG TPA: MFS transporter [candidate division Zixibacteria bacterium]|nr:MFS transporter [candidate division Zixibacteria bacterium]
MTDSAEQGLFSGRYFSRNYLLLLAIVFLANFASSMVSGSAVFFLVKSLAVTPEATTEFIGVLISVSSLAMISGSFAGGFLADRVGKKLTIGLACVVLAPSLFFYSVVTSVFLVVLAYFAQMFAMYLFQPAFTAFVADLSRLSSRGKAFGGFNLFWMISTVPAPLIGGVLVDRVELRFPFMIGSAVAVVGLVASFGLVNVSRRVVPPGQVSDSQTAEKAPMPLARVLWLFGAIALLTGLANGLGGPLIRDFPIYKLTVDATQLGLIFSLGSGLATALVQVPGGFLTDRFGRKPLMLASLLGAPFVVALAFTGSLFQFILVSVGLFAFGNLGSPAYQAWLMELVHYGRRARVWGLITAVMGVGSFFGPFISTWLWQTQAWVAVPFIVAAAPWVLQVPPILKLVETKTRGTRSLSSPSPTLSSG